MMAKRKKKITITELAKRLGVSPATVSNAMTGERYVKPETKEKVQKLAMELDYRPNLAARALLNKRRNIIGLLVPDINNSFYSDVIAGFEEILSKNDYTLMINSTHYQVEAERDNLKRFISLMVDGVAFVGGGSSSSHLDDLIADEFPVVFLNRDIGRVKYTQVLVDYNKAVKKAVKYLRGIGHRKIGYIGWKLEDIKVSVEKYRGYIDGLKENGLEVKEERVFLKDNIPENIYREYYDLTKEIYDRLKREKITALVAQTDQIAAQVLNCLKDIGETIPDDISIIGIGNIKKANYVYPRLTTVNLPKKRMGRFGAELLLKLISEGKNKDHRNYLRSTLIKRDTTRDIDQ